MTRSFSTLAAALGLATASLTGCTPVASVHTPAAPPSVAALVAAAPAPALAALDSATMSRHLAMLASDAFEGRGTGTLGEERTVEYVAAQMRAAGLQPGMPDGTFFQQVPLLGSTPQNVTPLRLSKGDQTESFTFVRDFTVATDLDAGHAMAGGEIVFVGYGIANAGYRWDDYKDVDVRGKILVAFVNDPPQTDAEPNLFQADTLTYNGRWTYKQEEARRRGAKALFLIHTAPTAGYPFQVLSATATREQIQLATPPQNPLTLKGWITMPTAQRLAQMAGTTLDAWFEAAARRDFRPQNTGVRLSVMSDFAVRRFNGTNVVGKIPGTTRAGESVLYTAHHDHLGKNEQMIADGRDGIYNGAVDNASGVAMLLTLAKAWAATPRPARTLYFASVTAEESGLLGSAYYAQHPAAPMVGTVADLNVDSGNLFGRTTDIVGLGAERSELAGLLSRAAAAEGMSVTGDPNPNAGLYFRSDQLSFARVGVPGVFFNTGKTFVGQEPGYAARIEAEYTAQRYHQPSDEILPGMKYGGAVQQMRVAYRMGYALAMSNMRPAWRSGEAFGETRAAMEQAAGLRP
ncbi:MAG: M28 family peptidase [Bacteroidetes bacterium]|nr:M28 family peptidase [Bacteroidota bacterium]